MSVTGAAAQFMDALFARCGTLVTGSPTLGIAYPETAFTPPASGKYLKVDYFSNKPAWEGLASGSLAQGLLQITVIWPRGVGTIQPAQIAQTVIAHFPKALSLFSGTSLVKITQEPYASSPLTDDISVRIPVTISWTGSDNS